MSSSRAMPLRTTRTSEEPVLTTPNPVLALLFAYGAAQFFVNPEPGAPEMVFPLLLLLSTGAALASPAILMLLAGNVMAVAIELIAFGSAGWSMVSLYLTLSALALLSVLKRYDLSQSMHALILGASSGAVVSLAALATPLSAHLYSSGIRFAGFFKDPNVTAPTTAFFAVLAFSERGRWRLLALPLCIVTLIALSRATFISAAVAIAYVLFFRNKGRAVFGTILIGVGLLFIDKIYELFDHLFGLIGRQGVYNWYDADRSSNWLELLKLSWDAGAPLGPGFSERNGMSVHSTYLRLLVEQGPASVLLFLGAILLAWQAARGAPAIRAALLCICANGAVVDATHWRVTFVAIAIALAHGGSERRNRLGASAASDTPRDSELRRNRRPRAPERGTYEQHQRRSHVSISARGSSRPIDSVTADPPSDSAAIGPSHPGGVQVK